MAEELLAPLLLFLDPVPYLQRQVTLISLEICIAAENSDLVKS